MTAVHLIPGPEDHVPDLLDIPGALAHNHRLNHFDFGRDRRDLRPVCPFSPADDTLVRLDSAHQVVLRVQAEILVARIEPKDDWLDCRYFEGSLGDRTRLIQI